MILIIDSYDSFTYILYQYVLNAGSKANVVRHDKLDERDILSKYKGVIISPGAARPSAKIINTVRRFSGKIPILGVCLGHQAIGLAFGAKLANAKKIMHGKKSKICHNGLNIFENIQTPLTVGRYHSLVIDKDTMPDCLEISAYTEDDKTIMAIQCKKEPTYGIQFHPESILTDKGAVIMNNFLSLTK